MSIITVAFLLVAGTVAVYLIYLQDIQNKFYLGGESDSDSDEEDRQPPQENFINFNKSVFQRPNIFEDPIYDKFIQRKVSEQLKDTLLNKNPKADILSGRVQIPSLFADD